MSKSCEEAYRDWLIADLCEVVEGEYGFLLRELFRREFYSLVKYDSDRARDGVMLREHWSDVNSNCDVEFGPCRILELLVGVACRMEFQLFGSKYADEYNYQKLFWVLIDNLGLLGFCDGFFVTCDVFIEKIVTVCDVFCDRKYTRDGFGNIFYIKNSQKDLRKLNIWDQMGLYMRHRWPL